MDATPCRFCPETAHEAICLGCKAKFVGLQQEIKYLKSQIEYFKAGQRGREMRMALSIKRKMNKRK